MNPLVELHKHGQSFWLDYIRRSMFPSGVLDKLIKEDGLRGMTSNPTIFEKAISSGNEYDADLKKLALQEKSTGEIFEGLAVSDIQTAADKLRPVYKSSGGADGFVSLEVSPLLANDTQGTISEAKRLWKKVNRPNLMIKVPGTPAGLPAIDELLASGLNINITLLFSLENYKQVLEAYLKALERRVEKGLPIKSIASVASFFVSRVDTIIDRMLDQKVNEVGRNATAALQLLHKSAIANAKLAYAHFQDATQSDRFQKLAKKGAQKQRLLWASTSTKDKRLHDVIYVNELIGPDTVNTMPPQTVEAFRDHGSVEDRLTMGLDQAREVFPKLAELGIDFEKAMHQLQVEGVKLFRDSFESLLRVVDAKRELLTSRWANTMSANVGPAKGSVEEVLHRASRENWVGRVWQKDATLWKKDAPHQRIITNSLGWLTVMDTVKESLPLLESIAGDVKKAGFTHALLLGMGGSSLAPEVLRLTFGKKAGYPDLAILDSTEPASVMERAKRSKPEKTLYIVASKSGSTTEPNAFLAYFYDQVKKKKGDKAGENFIAITDPGTSMEKVAREKKFRHIVLNPPDIGGRYAALSFFGMLPAAIMGIDVKALLAPAIQMANACSAQIPPEKNPGVLLGAALGSLAKAGRDKVTFFLSKEINSFATWVEQLIAESTGKEGIGILPVESEGAQPLQAYGNDRVFVSMRLKTERDVSVSKLFAGLKKAGHPVIEITLDDKYDLGAEFFRWEFATAVAGAVLGINPFDQPNVQEAKDLTRQFLEEYKSKGRLAEEAPALEAKEARVYSSNGAGRAKSLEEALQIHLSQIKPGDYVALLAYLERNPKNEALLNAIRGTILKTKKVATTVGFGPRFLHSTGQLHKGGPKKGVFIQITANDKEDVPIPGEPYTYSVLKSAQALGDLKALKNKHQRVIRIHLTDAEKGLLKLKETVQQISKN